MKDLQKELFIMRLEFDIIQRVQCDVVKTHNRNDNKKR